MRIIANLEVQPDIDKGKLCEMLNQAYAAEMQSFYLYQTSSIIAIGLAKGSVAEEFDDHAEEELKHANQIAERIQQIDGTKFVYHPEKVFMTGPCSAPLLKPLPDQLEPLIKINQEGEQCAIDLYKQIAAYTKDTDFTTYGLITDILAKEEEHSRDLKDLLSIK